MSTQSQRDNTSNHSKSNVQSVSGLPEQEQRKQTTKAMLSSYQPSKRPFHKLSSIQSGTQTHNHSEFREDPAQSLSLRVTRSTMYKNKTNNNDKNFQKKFAEGLKGLGVLKRQKEKRSRVGSEFSKISAKYSRK